MAMTLSQYEALNDSHDAMTSAIEGKQDKIWSDFVVSIDFVDVMAEHFIGDDSDYEEFESLDFDCDYGFSLAAWMIDEDALSKALNAYSEKWIEEYAEYQNEY